ncbi:MAG TPA: carboxypeptidase-like regulatory domain-containing protein [Calditrichia bacterium]|nr:carboxypeptidase-like regulatory domain-containing protein [Calditrichota bacterium]HQU71978.1 carboxypeptidase-like regulatory domain-containing protein [Calditrichia bacterium]HQV31482.1 carboxypeptidase-like regulatory domain-containing protein [Calditrichia bacterium]
MISRSLVTLILLLTLPGLHWAQPAPHAPSRDNGQHYFLSFQDTPLRTILDSLSAQSGVDFVFSDNLIDPLSRTFQADGLPFTQIMDSLLAGSGLDYQRPNPGQIILFAKPPATISGIVLDAANGDPLPFANISVVGSSSGTGATAEGYFVLVDLPPRPQLLLVEYMGYATREVRVDPSRQEKPLKISLETLALQVGDVEVAERPRRLLEIDNTPGEVRFSPADVALVPTAVQQDIFRSLQRLPGINSESDAGAGLYIRGGTPDQNLILLDGISIHQVDHLFGFLSAFNASAIKDVRVFQNAFPARFGGKTSAVIEMTGKTGTTSDTQLGFSADFLTLRGYGAIPLGSRATLLLSGRRANTDFLDSPLYREITDLFISRERQIDRGADNILGQRAVFHDTNAKLTMALNSRSGIAVSFFNARDDVNLTQDVVADNDPSEILSRTREDFLWKNQGYSIRLNNLYNQRIYSTLQFSSSRFSSAYQSRFELLNLGPTDILVRNLNQVKHDDLNLHNEVFLSPGNTFELGITLNRTRALFDLQEDGQSLLNTSEQEASYASPYLEHQYRNRMFSFRIGGRGVLYTPGSYLHFEPRLTAEYHPGNGFSAFTSWGVFHQYLKHITNEDIVRRNRDFWILANRDIPPESARHLAVGIRLRSRFWTLSLEGYRKTFEDLNEFALRFVSGDPADLTGADLYFSGSGESRGLDFLLQRDRGALTGWVGYSLSRVRQRFPELNGGQYFPSPQDRRHTLKFLGSYQWHSWHFSLAFNLASGRPFTEVESQYYITLADGTVRRYVTLRDRNDSRLEPYHRLDATLFYRGKGPFFTWESGLSVLNLYNRANLWYRSYNIFANPVTVRDITMLGFTPNVFIKIDLD